MDQFEREFTEKWIEGEEVDNVPQLVDHDLPNDHAGRSVPEDGISLPTILLELMI